MPRRSKRMTSRGLQPGRSVGLALAGGGPLGGIYEVGALVALADSLDGLDFNDLDVYVGVSSGGFVAAALANGISPAQMYRLFIDDGSGSDAVAGDVPASRLRGVREARAVGPGPACPRGARLSEAPAAARDDGIAFDAGPRGAHRNLQPARHRRVPEAPVQRCRTHRRFSPTAAQAFSGRHQPRHRRIGHLRCARSRPRSDQQGDPGIRGPARPVPSRGRGRPTLCRRRAQQDAARLGRARPGRGDAHLHQSAGAVRRQRRLAARAHQRGEAPAGRVAAGARANLSRDHPLAHEGRHGEISPAVPGFGHRVVRARPRERRHVLRQHIQLLAAQAAVRSGIHQHAAEPARAPGASSRRCSPAEASG